jgi:hypothetical protein
VGGHALTAATFGAVAQRVAEGAVCVIARRLYEAHVPTDALLPGRWTVVDRFDGPDAADAIRPFLGPADEARYRFANGKVVFKKGAGPDRIETDGLEASPAASSL